MNLVLFVICFPERNVSDAGRILLNLLSHMPRGDQSIVASALRTTYAQPNQEVARRQLRTVYDSMASR
jgi:transposase-like protein